jgi:hypothetical protein
LLLAEARAKSVPAQHLLRTTTQSWTFRSGMPSSATPGLYVRTASKRSLSPPADNVPDYYGCLEHHSCPN